ncbi:MULTISPECIES: hypothetical protein [unclassified Sphingomonas]|uniref:hypothetical protein n=1 Tax=unclassified Sphingomonas TaxID=196159 RepID=UPI0006F9098B|nr:MULTISPECIES: hypothetical protein [unclassified Sphingomonas]KQM60053.1 hypothetical protein ASE65_10125 [Sphingomonas sp. Leaf16]KQN11451.1 hypothetical protein ASE81_11110 [Sphingomonas sp. Leaf29]KQN18773.1 hypothetical protein ASE83_11050 [Sphingomonas sp. Leaf32]
MSNIQQMIDAMTVDEAADAMAAIRAKHFQYRDPIPVTSRPVDLTKPGDAPENAPNGTTQ